MLIRVKKSLLSSDATPDHLDRPNQHREIQLIFRIYRLSTEMPCCSAKRIQPVPEEYFRRIVLYQHCQLRMRQKNGQCQSGTVRLQRPRRRLYGGEPSLLKAKKENSVSDNTGVYPGKSGRLGACLSQNLCRVPFGHLPVFRVACQTHAHCMSSASAQITDNYPAQYRVNISSHALNLRHQYREQ